MIYQDDILVDPEDEWLLQEYTWFICDGYAARNTVMSYEDGKVATRKITYLHHCIMGQPIWEGDEIDHRNRDRLDDRRCNLRYVTNSQQKVNTSRQTGPSGERNIYHRDGRYVVHISRHGVRHHLGTYDTLDEAVATRDEWLWQNNSAT